MKASTPILEVQGVSKSFGGVRALRDLSFIVTAGGIHSIIGPNGAGKTTLFDLITGLNSPTAGRLLFEGRDITGQRACLRARHGMGRTFQSLQIFFNMSAIENVMVGAHLHLRRGFMAALLRLPGMSDGDAGARAVAAELLEFVGLGNHVGSEASAMPYGALKRLEIARALAAQPTMLLLDEPAAGLNSAECRDMDEVIRSIARRGTTVVLVEHDMKMVMGVSDHIIVLDAGAKLAEGNATDVRADPRVVAAYLGTET